ncbi:cadmium resistance transporter [Lactobacillus sp. 3B(2020)]|uniref:cadmium resistance transporter n=1 Tax=Lactobacillus sp. 3B(2020) TaxID=2695882 RepID=UPI0015DFA2F2|nr:cadmium resistance transporter [Lactobacillus sp. 3B(2020)]QLL69162.1 permease [Lactobacillus sp. 3B(2020)]
MNPLSILMVFISVNIDTFVFLLPLLPKARVRDAMIGLSVANLLLWSGGALLGKTLTQLFPDWITGILGIVLIYLAFKDEENINKVNANFYQIFLTCLSLGGDNLALYIPWASHMSITVMLEVSIIFILASVIMVWIGKTILGLKKVTNLIENYVNYGTKTVYLLAGCYVIWTSGLWAKLLSLFKL